MILGMDVSHGSPGRSDIPSIAAVVGSQSWPLISRYRASVRTQSSKVEMIDALFKPLANGNNDGIIRELLLDFYRTSNMHIPKHIIVFRDGVSESQFNQVLNIELEQIIKLSAGTVVDTKIVHPRNYDFYMCAHAGIIGTSKPAYYHALLDEIGFSPDDLQNLTHSLSYVYQRSTTAISVVALICYAHLAAAQMGQFLSLRIHLTPLEIKEVLHQLEVFLFLSSLGFIRMLRVRCFSAEILWMVFRKYRASFTQFFSL